MTLTFLFHFGWKVVYHLPQKKNKNQNISKLQTYRWYVLNSKPHKSCAIYNLPQGQLAISSHVESEKILLHPFQV